MGSRAAPMTVQESPALHGLGRARSDLGAAATEALTAGRLDVAADVSVRSGSPTRSWTSTDSRTHTVRTPTRHWRC